MARQNGKIRAITFDFWRTLYRARVNEAERLAARVNLLATTADIPVDTAERAMTTVMRHFLHTHVHEQRTLAPSDAVDQLQSDLNLTFSPDVVGELVEGFSTAILRHPPALLDRALDAVRAAAELVPVGLISDTGISPGRSLEGVLEADGLLQSFTSLTYSDRVGVSKPHEKMFHAAAQSLDVAPVELLHIGDLEPTDVAGALACGARAGLFGGDNTKYLGATRAHYEFRSWSEFIEVLPDIVS